jgi:hypothetical protein
MKISKPSKPLRKFTIKRKNSRIIIWEFPSHIAIQTKTLMFTRRGYAIINEDTIALQKERISQLLTVLIGIEKQLHPLGKFMLKEGE